MKPSYGIYNDCHFIDDNKEDKGCEVIFESGTIKVERLKGVGIMNKVDGSITLGKDDDELNTSTPIIYAISDNTTAIINDNDKGEINFYDGKTISIESIKNIFTSLLKKHYVFEEVRANNVVSYLKMIEEEVEGYVEDKSEEGKKSEEGSKSSNEKTGTSEVDKGNTETIKEDAAKDKIIDGKASDETKSDEEESLNDGNSESGEVKNDSEEESNAGNEVDK